MKKIVLTGGGTAGHVTPNIALLPALQAAGYEIAYVGSYEGIDKKLLISTFPTQAFLRANSADTWTRRTSPIRSVS